MRDLKLALRTLFRTPFVTVIAILSLALGIGANAAIYSLFDEMLLQHWRPPLSSDTSPFPKTPLVWSMTVRAWRQ